MVIIDYLIFIVYLFTFSSYYIENTVKKEMNKNEKPRAKS